MPNHPDDFRWIQDNSHVEEIHVKDPYYLRALEEDRALQARQAAEHVAQLRQRAGQ
jgi:hypothetical protein